MQSISSLEDMLASSVRNSSSGEEFWSLVSKQLRQAVPFDGACWFGIDPSTLLANYPIRVENVDQGHCESYWERECTVSDALLFRDLAKSAVPVGTLHAATGSQPQRSPRYREYLEPQKFGDELRGVFRINGRTWGAVDLYRQQDREAFTEQDVAVVSRVGTAIAGALRNLAVQEHFGAASRAPESTGTALFDHSGRLLCLDDQAERWFTEIGGPRWAWPTPPMTAVWAVVHRAASVNAGREWGRPVVRLRMKDRQWATLAASVLRRPSGAGKPGPIALTVSRAVGWDIAPLLVEAYGLTAREQEVCEAAVRGLSNQDIAARLNLSAYTVRDYLKAIFAKVDVTTRGELAARLFADFYEPRIAAPGAHVVHADF